MNRKFLIFALSALLVLQGCFPTQTSTSDDEVQPTEEIIVNDPAPIIATETPLPSPTPAPTTEPAPTPTAVPSVSIIASGGNLYIRRGPETAYNRIGILYKGSSAEVIGQDILSKWVQVRIPNTDQTGWISLLTPFTTIEGDLANVPAFTFTEWPEPAYIKNCTEHPIIIMPIELYLESLWTNPKYLNQAQIDPGFYEVRDASMEGEPLIEQVDIKEGMTYYVTLNGLGEYHKCPAEN